MWNLKMTPARHKLQPRTYRFNPRPRGLVRRVLIGKAIFVWIAIVLAALSTKPIQAGSVQVSLDQFVQASSGRWLYPSLSQPQLELSIGAASTPTFSPAGISFSLSYEGDAEVLLGHPKNVPVISLSMQINTLDPLSCVSIQPNQTEDSVVISGQGVVTSTTNLGTCLSRS
jgi:hypothetical protein